ncbi:MAG TPA: serine hydrolase, partial [Alphaproteobacteria bacterium]
MQRPSPLLSLRRAVALIAVFALCAAHVTPAEAAVRRGRGGGNPRYASIIMDAQTGQVLRSSNPDKRLYPASLTKMMTLFLTFEAIQRGRLHVNKNLDISSNATRQPPTKLGVRTGEQFTVKQAILALVTRSANDVAVVLAENVGGSEREFARMMNKRAQSLGMRNTNFANPSGLPNAAQTTTVRDMAILARALMQYFPNQYPLFSTRSFVYKREVITNHNHLMESFKGMDGLKTGFINASGFNLAASAVRNNRRLIVVVFGGRTAASRDAHVAQLLNEGFAMLPRNQQATQMASAAPKPLEPIGVPHTAPTQVATTTPASQQIQPVQIAPQPAVQPKAQAHVSVTRQAPTPSRPATTTTGNRAGWVPDGGQVRTLQLPPGYQQPQQQAVTATPTQAQPATSSGVLSPTGPASYQPSSEANSGWGIQVGA